MPCYRIVLAIPEFALDDINMTNEEILYHRLKHYGNAQIYRKDFMDSHIVFHTVLCDFDLSKFIQDLQTPFFVVAIINRENGLYLYKNTMLPRTTRILPPRHLVKKDIYWSAMHAEKNMIPESRDLRIFR
jgi:hypothetical protein